MISIDTENDQVIVEEGETRQSYALSDPRAFAAVSKAWLRAGWDTKYVYSFTWLGRPIIQLPEDMIRIQEVIFQIKPDLIIETGVAHGGSLIYYATLCKAMGKGRVIGIDIEIRPNNRKAIEEHFLFEAITLVEGSSVAPAIIDQVKSQIKPTDTVLVLLDSNHSKDHVLSELNAYGAFVSRGSYIVVTDGIMEKVVGAPRTQPDWSWNNPQQAALTFVEEHPEFRIEEPVFPFNEGSVTERVTYWPNAFIKRLK